MPVIIFAIGFLAFWLGYKAWTRGQRRKTLLRSPLSAQQRRVLAQHVPITNRLPTKLRARFEGRVRLFLDQIDFIGCGGLGVTETMRLSIAAQASLLVAGNDHWYRNLRTVLIYPDAFKSRQSYNHGYVVTERDEVRLGESWGRGPVVLSWAHSQHGALNDRSGRNVVFHEFAHQLDDLSGATNGGPLLGPHQDRAEWFGVFTRAFQRHVRAVRAGQPTLIDPYGAKAPEEFFAVVTELFFERPWALMHDAPKVYEQLREYYQVNPANWAG